jgi:SAM-dependent methyltransferase
MESARRHAAFAAFVLEQLPERRGPVLEVGCGRGEVASALAAAGCLVTAIDPEAPQGAIFQRVRLEDFVADEAFAAVVASLSLHHVHDLAAALDRIAALLASGGLLILAEFARERLTGETARWYHEQLGEDADFETWRSGWVRDHAGIHSGAELRRALDRRFAERSFEWTPYLYSYGLDDSLEPVERELIERGAIEATGFLYVGSPR